MTALALHFQDAWSSVVMGIYKEFEMIESQDLTEHLRKYGVVDDAPVRKVKPDEPLITPAEWVEIDRAKVTRAQAALDAVYLGTPALKPLHPNPLVCEVAEMLLKEFQR